MKTHQIVIFSLCFLFFQPAMSAYVEKIKGKKALIFLDGMTVNKGDLVYTVDETSGKKKSILRITTVKDEKAIGQIVKGQAKINQGVIAKSAAAKKSDSSEDAAEESSEENSSEEKIIKSATKFAIGGLLGVGFDSMDINLRDANGNLTESASQSGLGYSVMGAIDYHWSDLFALRGLLGLEQFNSKGDGSATGNSYTTEITYITGTIWGRVNIIQQSTEVWLGGGFGIMFPLSDSTNALDSSSIKTTAVYVLGGGADIRWSKDMYIPIQLEYGMIPKSPDVEASFYGIRAGVMFHY